MVRRKHPLEVFREQGRRFSMDAESPAREPKERAADAGNPAGADDPEPPRRSLRPRTEPPRTVTKAEPPAPERRAWSATGNQKSMRPPDAVPRRSLEMPLRRVATLLAGLVLVVGAAYALGLWPFSGMSMLGGAGSEAGSGQPTLKRWWFLPDWSDRVVPSGQDGTSEEAAGATPAAGDETARKDQEQQAGDDPGTKAGSKGPAAARASAEVEYWILAGSVKLKAADRKGGAWRELFKPDEQRIRTALEKERSASPGLPEFTVKPCYADATHEDVLLLVGPAASADDAALAKLLPKVKALGERFKDAKIKAYRKP